MRRLRAVITVVTAVLLVTLGIAAVVYGEGDDSPGLQGIGGLVVLTVVVIGARRLLACRRTDPGGTSAPGRQRRPILRR